MFDEKSLFASFYQVKKDTFHIIFFGRNFSRTFSFHGFLAVIILHDVGKKLFKILLFSIMYLVLAKVLQK